MNLVHSLYHFYRQNEGGSNLGWRFFKNTYQHVFQNIAPLKRKVSMVQCFLVEFPAGSCKISLYEVGTKFAYILV